MARWNPFGKKEDNPVAEGSTESPPVKSGDSPAADEQGGMFGWAKSALRKTVNVLNTDIRDLVGKEGRLVDDEFLDELFAYLIKTDMGNGPAGRIRGDIQDKFRGRKVMMSDLVDSAKETILEMMKQESAELAQADSGPTVIMVVGVNGSGKTTSIAKLCQRRRAFREAAKTKPEETRGHETAPGEGWQA